MVDPNNILKSTKRYGRYEKPIIEKIASHFSNNGYEVVPHARFNISWGCMISDLDLLLIRQDTLTAVEVKSKRDKISRAVIQLEKLQDFVDYVYVATEEQPAEWEAKKIGLIVVNDYGLKVLKPAEQLKAAPDLNSVFSLNKKCLSRMSGMNDASHINKNRKFKLAEYVKRTANKYRLKEEMKDIITCSLQCDNDCPILRFDNKHFER